MTVTEAPRRVRRVLALSPIPEEGAGYRFRISQFIPYLESLGYQVTVSPFFTPEFFRLVYRPGHYLKKIAAFAGLSLGRLRSLRGVSQYDLVVVYREAFPIGPPLIAGRAAAGRPISACSKSSKLALRGRCADRASAASSRPCSGASATTRSSRAWSIT